MACGHRLCRECAPEGGTAQLVPHSDAAGGRPRAPYRLGQHWSASLSAVAETLYWVDVVDKQLPKYQEAPAKALARPRVALDITLRIAITRHWGLVVVGPQGPRQAGEPAHGARQSVSGGSSAASTGRADGGCSSQRLLPRCD